MEPSVVPLVIVVMGAAGAGKTTVGRALADALHWSFVDADDLHTGPNIDKMRRGEPLTDDDRAPWLVAVHAAIGCAVDRQTPAVIACSALRAHHRHLLRDGRAAVRFVYLKAHEDLLRARLTNRVGHFAGPGLVASQLAHLEEPHEALTVDASAPPEIIVEDIRHAFGV
jgi:gluconokinase